MVHRAGLRSVDTEFLWFIGTDADTHPSPTSVGGFARPSLFITDHSRKIQSEDYMGMQNGEKNSKRNAQMAKEHEDLNQ